MKKSIKNFLSKSPFELYSYFKTKNNIRNTVNGFNTYKNTVESPKLHIGCGGNVFNGWFNIDFEHIEKDVYYMDASQKFPFPDESFDYIYSEHLFEHLDINGQISMLNEAFRTLKNGGTIRIATPNFDFITNIGNEDSPFMRDYIKWSAKAFFPDLESKLGDISKTRVYCVNNYFYSWGHKFIHSRSSLKGLLNYVGFKEIIDVNIYESKIEIFKNIEKHGTVIPKEFNDAETMVLEAIK